MQLEIGGKGLTTRVVVADLLTTEAVLGLDVLKEHCAVIDLNHQRVHLDNKETPLRLSMATRQEAEYDCLVSTVTVSSSSTEIRKAQQEDVTIDYFLKAKEDGKKPRLGDVQGVSQHARRLLEMWSQLESAKVSCTGSVHTQIKRTSHCSWRYQSPYERKSCMICMREHWVVI